MYMCSVMDLRYEGVKALVTCGARGCKIYRLLTKLSLKRATNITEINSSAHWTVFYPRF